MPRLAAVICAVVAAFLFSLQHPLTDALVIGLLNGIFIFLLAQHIEEDTGERPYLLSINGITIDMYEVRAFNTINDTYELLLQGADAPIFIDDLYLKAKIRKFINREQL